MSYTFRGVLTKREEVANTLVVCCADCEVKRDLEQLGGYIVRFPCEGDLHPMQGEEAYEKLFEQLEQLRSTLPQISAQYPNDFIVYLEVECFGGTCGHSGMHLSGGRVIAEFDAGPAEIDLEEILRPLHVRLGEHQFFRPLTRGYFERDALQNWNRPWPPTVAGASP